MHPLASVTIKSERDHNLEIDSAISPQLIYIDCQSPTVSFNTLSFSRAKLVLCYDVITSLIVKQSSMPELKVVTAPANGTVADVKFAVGDSITEGALLAIQSMVKVCEVIEAPLLHKIHFDGRHKQTFRLPLQGE